MSKGRWLESLACAALIWVAGCGSGEGSSVQCECPAGELTIVVPADRIADVQAVTATGACSNVSANVSAIDSKMSFSVQLLRTGTCHVSITFQSGAPEFDADVPAAPCSGGACCAACGPQATGPVLVPEG